MIALKSHSRIYCKWFRKNAKEKGALTGTILIVEDQDSARESLVDLLKAEGFEVHAAEDGKAGIALVDQYDLDLVLTDLAYAGRGWHRRAAAHP